MSLCKRGRIGKTVRGGGTRGKILCHNFDELISLDNLLLAWREFSKGKRNKSDVQAFGLHLMDNLFELHHTLKIFTYRHGSYQHFKINDPKPRDIHKASVRDRLVHHAIHRVLYHFFDRKFIADSYSCRLGKGTHKATKRFCAFVRKVSQNNTSTCWVLKCDIRKFFASIDHVILKQILAKHIKDKNILWLLSNVIDSFSTTLGRGLPLGNLTSQLLVNIYMNEFDQFAKHSLKAKHYIRYADDFVFLSCDRSYIERTLSMIAPILTDRLRLGLHSSKCFIKTIASGVDFLGWVHFPDHRVLRTATKHRMLRNLSYQGRISKAKVNSYLGMLGHGNAYKLKQKMLRYVNATAV